MPSCTHVRRAQPVLAAHYLLAHAAALRRDVDHFEAVRAEADALPPRLGGDRGHQRRGRHGVSRRASRLLDVVRNNKDLQEDKEALFDTEDTLMGSAGAAAAVVRTLTLDRARSAKGASGFLLSTDVADYLVGRGVAFRTAHEVVGGMVRRLLADGRDFDSLTPAEWRTFHPALGDNVMRVVTAQASVRAKRTPQSTNPDAVRTQMAEIERWLADAKKRQ
jgi:argininosuccinate lyase